MLLNCYDDRVAFFYVVELLYNINPFPSLCCVRYRRDNDVGWGMFVNFLSYKLEREDKLLVEIDRFFPSSHICPECLTQQPKMDLSVREWTCINKACNAHHDRDEAASKNIRAEGIRILKVSHCGLGGFRRGASGEPVRADGAAVSASVISSITYTTKAA